MRAFIADFRAFLFGQRDHPIYQRERRGWSYIGLWRKLRSGCLPLMALVIILPACACGLMAAALAEDVELERFTFTALLALLGFFAGGQWILWLAGLLATALTATAISAEVETQSFALLRMTDIPPRHIVLAKFAAVLTELRLPLWASLIVRVIFPPALIAIVILMFVANPGAGAASGTPGPSPPAAALPPVEWLTLLQGVANVGLAVVSLLVAGLVWLIFYLVGPFLQIMLFAAVGMFGSSLARTRTNGLFTAAGIRVAMGGLSYVLSQMFGFLTQLAMLPVAMNPTSAEWFTNLVANNPAIIVVFMAAIFSVSMLAIMGGQLGATLLLLHWTARRAERLPFG